MIRIKQAMRIVLGAFVLLGIPSLAFAVNSISLNGNFENEDGCRVYGAYCLALDDINGCQFEVYQDGEYVVSMGKAAKIESFNSRLIVAKDLGLRSGFGIPSYVNRKAEIKILESFVDPYSYAELGVSSFDLKVSQGVLGKKVIECKNLRLERD